MTTGIQPLSSDVIHLIAAGEVIDSLAAVVRELVENAIDANATRINISVWADQWKVRVADNGNGMTHADLQNAALPHSTSKIRGSTDLTCISSLGFRGEALHSLAQLADLDVCSRWSQSDHGWWVSYDHHGTPIASEVAAIAVGTVVTVTNLFYTWERRRQSLPTTAQQLRTVQTIIQHSALCHPHITWQVEQSDRPWFSIWGGASAQAILPQILRDAQPTDFLPVELPCPLPAPLDHAELSTPERAVAHLSALIGLPDRCHRYRPDWVKVAVNGRTVRLPELEQFFIAGFRRTLPRDRFPVGFLHLHCPPQHVDWNRHPAKTDIYLNHLEHWQQQVSTAIEQALSAAHLADPVPSLRLTHLLKTAEQQAPRLLRETAAPYGANLLEEDDRTNSIQTDLDLRSPLKAIAQVHQMYILAEHPTGVWLIEQHIAHERVLYEQLRDRWQIVPLATPIPLSRLTLQQQDHLHQIGVQLEPFGEDIWAARSAPAPLAERDDCAAALRELSLTQNIEAALVATACRTAIRNGMVLNLSEMQTLIDQWQQTRNPRTCPHGRPICLSLEESSLSRFFRRHWVIGKSHGI